MDNNIAENVIKKYGETVYEILDNTLFMDGWEKDGLIRQLLRMGYSDNEAQVVLNAWINERGYKIESIDVIS